ncbi:MAG TPA: B12-binding domain-containing protein [Polyangiaceae bacterium]|nr:B12-binding domain-containing protein [Polyangiaceae bacterium]
MSRYRIQAVSKLCGVPPATLRAWERRYGVPAPARTASAYRLYGDEDIALITKMRDLVKGGMAAAEAARTVLADASRAPLPESHEDDDPFGDAADRIVDSVVRFDPEGLDKEVNRALGLGSAIAIFENTLAPAMREIGNLWHEGTLTVAQEHLASNLIGGTLLHLLRLTQPVGQTRRAVLACFADEDHTLGLYGIGLRFASWSFRTLLLGARTPPAAIARVVESLDPDIVALSATLVPPAANARELIDAYADACRSTVWIVGGAGAQAMRPWIEARGGIAASDDPQDVRKMLERALRAKKRVRQDDEALATEE